MNIVSRWLFNYGQPTTKADTTVRGLPASWYRSPEMYELERRAVFSKKWMLITHKLRFEVAGDYLRFTEAGFSFFLCLDRQGNIGGFHNICRHRGFPLIHDDRGNASILSCRYHGWSYGLNGKLAKAKHFDQFPNFDKSTHGLSPVHVHVDQLGFVWVNLDASEVPATSWTAQLDNIDLLDRYKHFNFSEYKFDHIWGMQGDYNWKTLADNYNECLHCRTAHPDTNNLVEIEAYRVEGKAGTLRHFNKRQEDGRNDDQIQIASAYYFPNACMTVSPHFFYLMRCVPTSASTCSMEYEVYRHKDASDADFENIDQIFKRVLAEDKWLCNGTQQTLNAGVHVAGPLHSRFEQGPLYFQQLVKDTVMAHRKEEVKQKKEIWPAARSTGYDEDSDESAFCASLQCDPKQREALAW